MTTPAAPGTAQQAERLWVTAHEHVRRGDFAAATRDLSQAFAILQALKDPRVAEVHKRWTEVHRLYVEDAGRSAPQAAVTTTTQQQQQQQQQQKAAPAPTLEAEAEAAANAGNLEQAIQLYEKALAQKPENELVAERLVELRAARPRAAELSPSAPTTEKAQPHEPDAVDAARRDAALAAAAADVRDDAVVAVSASVTVATSDERGLVVASSQVSAVSVGGAIVGGAIVGGQEDLELEGGPDIDLDEARAIAARAGVVVDTPAADADIHEQPTLVPQPATTQPPTSSTSASTAPATPRTAPVMNADDAPIGMGSLDVSLDVGSAVSAFVADELPVDAAAEQKAPSSEPADPVAFLEELLRRVQQNRRKHAA